MEEELLQLSEEDLQALELADSDRGLQQAATATAVTERAKNLFAIISNPSATLAEVKQCVEMNPPLENLNIFNRTDYRRTPLHYAARYNKADIAAYLLSMGADLNKVENGGYSPLHYSCSYNSPDVAKVFLENGADPNTNKDGDGFPAKQKEFVLFWAAGSGSTEIVSLLIRHGAHVHGAYLTGALSIAMRRGHLGVMRLLLQRTTKEDLKSQEISSAFVAACYRSQTNAVRLFLEHDPTILDNSQVLHDMVALDQNVDMLFRLPVCPQFSVTDKFGFTLEDSIFALHYNPQTITKVCRWASRTVSRSLVNDHIDSDDDDGDYDDDYDDD